MKKFSDLSKDDIKKSIIDKRKRLEMTRKQLSDVLDLSKEDEKSVSKWESGSLDIDEETFNKIMAFPEEPTFTNMPIEQARFKIIDLFAGIGGIRLAFQKCGCYTVFSSEFDKFAQKTYKANFGELPNGDITEIDEKTIPEHDILVAGFPCQPFSNAGLKKGFEDTRGTLFFDISRILEAKRPKAIMLENVKQLKGHDKGRTLSTMLNVLDNLGYYVPEPQVLKSIDFGVPQNRERIIIVGFLKDNIIDKSKKFEYPVGPKLPTRVGDILEKNVSDKHTISDKLYQGHIERRKKHAEKGNGFGFSVFNEDSPYTNTISARYYKDGSEALIDQGENKNPRKLTPRECARLQGFPDEFIIPVSNMQAYKQFGNSVSVPLIQAVAEKIVDYMTNNMI